MKNRRKFQNAVIKILDRMYPFYGEINKIFEDGYVITGKMFDEILVPYLEEKGVSVE